MLSQFFNVSLGFLLVQLFVLVEHDCNCHVEKEEGANHHAANAVKDHYEPLVGVHVDVHDLSPAFHSDALENSQECETYVVEISYSPVKLLHICVSVPRLQSLASLYEVVQLRSTFIVLRADRSANRAQSDVWMRLVQRKVILRTDSFWCIPTPVVDLARPKTDSKDSEDKEEKDS